MRSIKIKSLHDAVVVAGFIFILFFNTAGYFSVGDLASASKFLVFGMDPRTLASYMMLVMSTLNILLSRRVRLVSSTAVLVFALYVFAFSLSPLFNYNGLHDLNAVVGLLILIFYCYTLYVFFAGRLLFFLNVLVFYSLISSLFALLLMLGISFGGFYQPSVYSRMVGWYGNPNLLATVLGVGLIICFYLYLVVEGAKSRAISLALLFVSLVLTGTKSVLAIVFFILFMCSILRFFEFIKTLRLTMSSFYFFCGGSFLLFFTVISLFLMEHALLEQLADRERITSASGRTDIWVLYLKDFLNSDLLSQVVGKGRLYLTQETSLGVSAHSLYVRGLVEHGAIYLLIVMFMFASTMIYAFFRWVFGGGLFFLFSFFIVLFIAVRNVFTPDLLGSTFSTFVFFIILFFLYDKKSSEAYCKADKIARNKFANVGRVHG